MILIICYLSFVSYYLQLYAGMLPIRWELVSAYPCFMNWDLTVKYQAWQAVLPVQLECTNPALELHELPVLMLLFELSFLLLGLLSHSEQQAEGPYLNLCLCRSLHNDSKGSG